MTIPLSKFNQNHARTFAMFVAGILLNLGLFFLLAVFAPLVVGIALGYILAHKRNSIITSILSATVAYSLIFVLAGFGTNVYDLSVAVLIMSLIGAIGGYVGVITHDRIVAASTQVSTTILPGE